MEYASMNYKNKFDDHDPSEKMVKEISSKKEDFELYYEKDLGVNL